MDILHPMNMLKVNTLKLYGNIQGEIRRNERSTIGMVHNAERTGGPRDSRSDKKEQRTLHRTCDKEEQQARVKVNTLTPND
eukprot:5236002-Pleurochrysis_carterae.AAC.1